MVLYLAGPLFTAAERQFNNGLAIALEQTVPNTGLIVPQRYAESIAGTSDFLSRMFTFCLDSVRKCDFVIAVLDGSDADSGTCIEIGFAHAVGKPVIGIRTDIRESEDRGLNLMVAGVCKKLVRVAAPEACPDHLAAKIKSALAEIKSGMKAS